MDAPRCYAVRRVNPFEGVLQIVETHNARAYSPNGRAWQVQVLARRPDHTWRSSSDAAPIEQFFNFGLWDPVDGLHRIPANPVMDIGAMSETAQTLAAILAEQVGSLPFPLRDRYECWATGDRGEPVALLATTESATLAAHLRVGHWQATRPAEHGFVSDALLAAGIPARGERGPRQHAELIERRVRQLGRHETWFERADDGSGRRLDSQAPPTPVDADFPSLGLKRDWPDPQTRALATDYLAWCAPRLLMLQHIGDDDRRWLERAARRRALELADAYRLLPRIIDRNGVEAARVEARMRRSA